MMIAIGITLVVLLLILTWIACEIKNAPCVKDNEDEDEEYEYYDDIDEMDKLLENSNKEDDKSNHLSKP